MLPRIDGNVSHLISHGSIFSFHFLRKLSTTLVCDCAMLSLWHRVSVSLIFDLRQVKSSADESDCVYTYKKPNAISCFMFCTPTFDILFTPTKTMDKKSCIKTSKIMLDSTQNTSSDNDIFVDILNKSTKKSPTSYDYNNMFPLLIQSPLIQRIACACFIEYQDFQSSSGGKESHAVQYKPNAISILFKTKEDSKKLRQIGLLFGKNVTNSTLFKQSIYPTMLHDSLRADDSLQSSNASQMASSSREVTPSRSKSGASLANRTLDTSDIVEKMNAVMKNIHKRATTFIATGTGVLQSKINGYMAIRPLHISSNNMVHLTILCGIGKVLLEKNQYLGYLKSLDFQSTPGLIVKHQGLFEIIRRQIIDSCEHTATVDPFFWHMIGFQGASPLTDFRASSLLSLISLRIFADQYPDILLSESYGDYEDELDGVNHILFICARKMTEQIRESLSSLPNENDAVEALESLLNNEIGTSKRYSYPIALSILDITHYIFNIDDISRGTINMTPFLTLLTLDFAVRYSEFVNTQITASLFSNDAQSIRQPESTLTMGCLVTAKELETTPVTEHILERAVAYKEVLINLFESGVQRFAEDALTMSDPMKDTMTGVTNYKIKYGPWKEFHNKFWRYFNVSEHFMIPLAANVPAPIFDGIFRVIVGLSLLMYKRMQLIPIKQRYFQYTTVRAKLIKDFNEVLLHSTNCPIYTIENFLVCLSKLGSGVD